ncbi:MAG: anthranilate phosphoribosyltransferase [Gemmatimonadetes bacterium]|nr:anthranilate phosphoribosyltransferase [Gemmatimonadota bacterium]
MPQSDPVSRAILALADRRDLTAEQAKDAFGHVMAGESTPVLTSALLMGLRAKGETPDEVVGAAVALRTEMVRVTPARMDGLIDTCGTGGGRLGTFNISTAATLVAVGAGARVAKHGNRSFTSRSGSADVLEALGVPIPQNARAAAELLERCGMTFLFAPLFHPAMRHVGPVRRELGLTTIMNLVGPLANPAGVRRQLVGVPDESRAPLMANALARLDCERALVVHARAGMDEISPVGPTDVWEVRDGAVSQWVFEPESFGLPAGDLADLAGGSPEDNARIVERVVCAEDRSIRYAAVVINAAAALVAAGTADEWKDAVARAQAAISEGRAAQVLAQLRAAREG